MESPDGKPQGSLPGHKDWVTCVASRRPTAICWPTASLDHTVKLWDADGKKETGAIPLKNSVWGVAFSGDGKLVGDRQSWRFAQAVGRRREESTVRRARRASERAEDRIVWSSALRRDRLKVELQRRPEAPCEDDKSLWWHSRLFSLP